MTKKDFSNLSNPATNFLEEMNTATKAQTKSTTTTKKAKTVKNTSESRSQHASFLLKPSTANSLKMIAKFEGTSANNIANQLLDKYVADYRKNPAQAKKLDQALELFS
ncbi:hypothetical protein FOL85_09650 [Lactobacillus reuteri]|uniref:hypothetical protein n=1 Tax=Limosilactobacillus reuteri TaxID=1598 RepID=UPI00146BD59E|nr:hypothetical protein [Limosilactobacillus reuteri]NMV53055.1 hypothetical protein [Limosilactobacillus reuteri]NMV56851.1 hypothetical protein [Limosilactobacillus reuteri]NMV65259.1 hypothetical protein [Limosilactobacillus reuteri]